MTPREPKPGARYVVVSVVGHSAAAGCSRPPATSYSVLDSAYCWREVYRAYTGLPGGKSRENRLRACQAEADRLNAMDAEEVAA